jgi:CO/xanthine dehydrogenase FAD-binding subunit
MPEAYERPTSLDAALGILADGDWTILAGGTDVYPAATDAFAWGRPTPQHILDISAINGLSGIQEQDDWFRIGSRVTWTELVERDLPRYFDGLKQASREVGGVQIQNRATLVGNICNASPAADGVPALITMDAKVEIASSTGTRTLPLSDFLQGNRLTALGETELVTAILVPKRGPAARSAFLKLGARSNLVISIAMVAAVIDCNEDNRIQHARVAVGSCSVVAQRLLALEESLIGRVHDGSIDSALTPAMLSPLSPIDDVRGNASYRQSSAKTLVRRLLTEIGSAT